MQVALHVQSDAAADGLAGADAIDGFLHLAVTPVAALHRVGGGWQQGIVQKGQGLFQVRREQLFERPPEAPEAADAPPEAGQPGQGGLGPASSVKEAVHFVHDLAQGAQGGQAAADPPQGLLLSGRQVVLNE